MPNVVQRVAIQPVGDVSVADAVGGVGYRLEQAGLEADVGVQVAW